MKIMYLMDVYQDPYAGTEKQLYWLISGLAEYGIEPALTLFRPSTYINGHGFPCAVRVLNIRRLLNPRTLIAMIGFALALRRQGYRLVHIFFNDASLLAPLILKAAGIRVIISRRDMGFWYTPARLAILRFNRFFIDCVVANCEAVKRITNKEEKVPLENIHVIYNGHAPVKAATAGEATQSLSVQKPGTRLIGIVANIRPVKRIGDLIRACGLLRQRCPDTALVIVGSGDVRPLQQLADEVDMSAHICFTGAQTDIIPLIRQFDVAVLCSESEGLSNAIIEYMQCLVPVVCTDTGGNNELVIDGETGYLVPVGDIEMLAEKIRLMLTEPERAAAMARRAAERVAKLCDPHVMLAKHAALYRELVS